LVLAETLGQQGQGNRLQETMEIIASLGFVVGIYFLIIGMMIMWDKEK